MFWRLSLAGQGVSGAMGGRWVLGPTHTVGVLLAPRGTSSQAKDRR